MQFTVHKLTHVCVEQQVVAAFYQGYMIFLQQPTVYHISWKPCSGCMLSNSVLKHVDTVGTVLLFKTEVACGFLWSAGSVQ